MKLNKILAGVLSLVIVGGTAQIYQPKSNDFSINASAESYKTGTYGKLSYNKYSDHIEIRRCDTSATKFIVIPDEIDGIPVTQIKEYAFYKCAGITSVTIPDSVTNIEQGAFEECTNLTSVTIPNGVTSIENYTFRNTSLTSAIIPDGVTIIGAFAFQNCTNLTSVTIPDSVTSIGVSAFKECASLTSVIIPKNVTVIKNGAFDGCTNLTYVTTLDSITIIGRNAFRATKWLDLKRQENPLVIISGNLIDGKTATGVVNVPDNVTRIEGYAFSGCTGLTSVTIPDSVTSIGLDAFSNCSNLDFITIKNPKCEILIESIYNSNYKKDDKTIFEFYGTIYGYPNSTAQAYAEEYNYNFVALDDESAEIKYGDANGDGDVTIADAVLILQSIANPDKYKLTEKGRINADVVGNGDGVTANDALTIQMVEAGNYKAEDLPIK